MSIELHKANKKPKKKVAMKTLVNQLQSLDAALNICGVCFSPEMKNKCGLFAMTAVFKQLLLDVFNTQIDNEANCKICPNCISFLNQAAEFKEMAKRCNTTSINDLQRERSVSAEPGSDSEAEVEIKKEKDDFSMVQNKPIVQVASLRRETQVKSTERQTTVQAKRTLPTRKVKWKCECGIVFASQALLNRHCGSHSKVNQRKVRFCHTCGLKVADAQALADHKRMDHRKGKKIIIAENRLNFSPKPLANGETLCCGEKFSQRHFSDHKKYIHPEHFGKFRRRRKTKKF